MQKDKNPLEKVNIDMRSQESRLTSLTQEAKGSRPV